MNKKVQIGDKWTVNNCTKNVVRANDHKVGYWYIDHLGNVAGDSAYVVDFVGKCTLIERDGDPVREFEEGAHYPIITCNGNKIIGRYESKRMNIGDGRHDRCKPDIFEWIGPKLEIEWPEN